MSDELSKAPGTIAWHDLTVSDADGVRDFYQAVIGWTSSPVEMEGYNDFHMRAPDDGSIVAGVCHKRGTNAELPSQWLLYINVADLDHSLNECQLRGGRVQLGPKDMGSFGRYAIIEDPAGAVCALFEPAPGDDG